MRPSRSIPPAAAAEPGTATLAQADDRAHARDRVLTLEREADGYFARVVPAVRPGTCYRFRVDDRDLADPASRFQPAGPSGPSQVIDPSRFAWTDAAWTGQVLDNPVVYELHIGTFTPEGTWHAAAEKLSLLAEAGVTVVEVMPVAEFPGRFGWGYDGVFPYAPTRLYGTPDDFRAFVDRAHAAGVAVILDVVYNHLGPDGCVFSQYAKAYFTDRFSNEWGEALNFDATAAAPARAYWASNAAYWIEEFHLDGLRLDATQSVHDDSPEHILGLIAAAARTAAGRRRILLVSENEPQHVRMVRPHDAGGYGLDALWNDDFHHSAVVALTGRNEAYYSDHRGTPQELISAAKHGYLFQGQRYAWQKAARGTRTDGLPPASFVNFLENHDQLANSGDGSRVRQRTSPGRYRAMVALCLLMPGIPMLFQGQEFGATAPFLYFADHAPELAAAVAKGRAEFVSQFPSLASADGQAQLAPPDAAATFERCRLDWSERDRHTAWRDLFRDLLAMRRDDAVFRPSRKGLVDGAVLAAEAFVLRYGSDTRGDERLLVVNLGPDLVAGGFAEPLVAPPDDHEWHLAWSSESPRYGGLGTPDVLSDTGWRLPGHAAFVLRAEKSHDGDAPNRH